MSQPRERRGLVPVEIAMVFAIAVVPWPQAIPIALPLVVCASISRWVRGRSFNEVLTGGVDRTAIVGLASAAAGMLALVLAVVAGTRVVEVVTAHSVEWSVVPIVRGMTSQLVIVIVLVTISSVAWELALRGWIVERVVELSPGPPILAVLLGGVAEAIVTPGSVSVRIGALLFGIGLGWMYIAAGRSVVAPILARTTFQVGAVVLEALHLIG